MKFQTYLIKYGEIGIKGKNRYMFEDALVRQIRHSLKDLDGLFHTYKAQGRVYVDCDGDYDGDEVVEALKRVFGIVGICPVVRVEDKGFEELKKEKFFKELYTVFLPWKFWEFYKFPCKYFLGIFIAKFFLVF